MDRPDWQPPTSEPGRDEPMPPTGSHAVPVTDTSSDRRRPAVVLGVIVAVAAVGLAGVFAVGQIAGSNDGGAATADELGSNLLAAIGAEDVLGVVDTLLPGERASLGEPFVEFVGELRRLEVLDESADPGDVAGFDVELADTRVTVRTTNVDDIANVEMSATATLTVDGATLPIGDLIAERLGADELSDMRGTRSTETDELALELTAVEQDGRWYFSVFHTLAELARESSDAGDVPDRGILADGADSPEAAVDRVLDRVGELDLGGVIAVLDPAEAMALQRYAPLFIDDAGSALDEVPLQWRVDVREFRAEGDGDERTVFFDALGITGDLDGVPFSVRTADGCVRVDIDGETDEQCGTEPGASLDGLLDGAPEVEEFVDVVTAAFADIEPVGLELRRRDGEWFVSPFATGTEALLAAMRALDADELAAIVDAGQELAADASDVVEELLDDQTFGDEAFGDEAFDDEAFDDEAFDEAFESQAVDECYGIEDATSAAACFGRAIDAGEIDPTFAPAALVHPECGIAEYSWQGRWYELSDEEFTSVVLAAVPCFDRLVDDGEMERWVVPFEVLYVECFEGRNWYAVYEADYNDRVSACIESTPVFDD